jgi:hypothetical protein
MAIKGGYLTYNDSTFEYICKEHGINSDELRRQLLSTKEFMEEGDRIRPINATTYLLTEEDESGWVSSERERFDQWCSTKNKTPRYMVLMLLEE